MPRQLEITTTESCPVNCTFCPRMTFENNYRGTHSLRLEDFKVALSNTPMDVTVVFSGFSEPFNNPQCIDMIEHAANIGHKVILFTTLVGASEEDVARLSKIKFTQLCLHLPDNLGNAKIPLTHQYKDVLSSAFTLLKIDNFSVMNANFVSNERAGNCINVPRRYFTGWFSCMKLIRSQFTMLPDGCIVLCCMDFGLKHQLGNLLTSSYDEIAESKEFRRIKQNRFRWGGNVLCRHCTFAVPMYKHVIYGIHHYMRTQTRNKTDVEVM